MDGYDLNIRLFQVLFLTDQLYELLSVLIKMNHVLLIRPGSRAYVVCIEARGLALLKEV
jgi:hypothetical protein